MKTIKIISFGLSVMLFSTTGFSQEDETLVLHDSIKNSKFTADVLIKPAFNLNTEKKGLNEQLILNTAYQTNNISSQISLPKNLLLKTKLEGSMYNSLLKTDYFDSPMTSDEKEPFFKNKRNVYSSLWAFASLNYLYADLMSLMDKNTLSEYQSGEVNGIEITPSFLASAALFIQVPLANVFLPQVIKNDRALRWVQIASGTVMSLVQTGTLFVGKPSPSYLIFSALEIATTTFITIDALKWKTTKKTRLKQL